MVDKYPERKTVLYASGRGSVVEEMRGVGRALARSAGPV